MFLNIKDRLLSGCTFVIVSSKCQIFYRSRPIPFTAYVLLNYYRIGAESFGKSLWGIGHKKPTLTCTFPYLHTGL